MSASKKVQEEKAISCSDKIAGTDSPIDATIVTRSESTGAIVRMNSNNLCEHYFDQFPIIEYQFEEF